MVLQAQAKGGWKTHLGNRLGSTLLPSEVFLGCANVPGMFAAVKMVFAAMHSASSCTDAAPLGVLLERNRALFFSLPK